MNRISHLLFTACMAACVLPLTVACAQTQKFDVAITVDDLPAHGALPPGVSRTDVARDYLAALKQHKVPAAYGFVNAVRIEQEPDSEPVLKMWRDAGYPLGNHTYAHKNINDSTPQEFQAAIEANEPILQRFMGNEDWHYLRFPNLSAGNTPERHNSIMAYLKAHHYRIADVSMSFSDWAYTDAYARCMAKGDAQAVSDMKTQYMQGVTASIVRARALSQQVYGRDIAYVLLTHEGAFSALMLPQVLTEFEARGAHYVTLDQAQNDPAYSAPSDHKGEGMLIERTAQEKGIDISKAPADVSIANLNGLCR